MNNLRDYTQKQKIIHIMAREPEKFFFPYEFMQGDLGDLFVGYKASTRIAELAKDHPYIFESKLAGKYVIRRLKLENVTDWLYDLPKDLRFVLHKMGKTSGVIKPTENNKAIQVGLDIGLK